MAFCKYCGKELEDGEVCNCRQNAQTPPEGGADAPETASTASAGASSVSGTVAAFAEAAKQSAAVEQGKKAAMNIFSQAMPLLKAPATNAASFIGKEDVFSSGILMALHGLCSSIFAAIFIGKINSLIGIGGSFMESLKLSGVGGFFQTWAYSLILAVAFAGICLGLTKLMKGQLNFKQALGVAAMRSVISIPVVLVSCLLLLINMTAGIVCFYIIGTLAGICFFATAIHETSSLSSDKKVYLVLAVTVVFILVSLVFAKLVCQNYLPAALKGSFSLDDIMGSIY